MAKSRLEKERDELIQLGDEIKKMKAELHKADSKYQQKKDGLSDEVASGAGLKQLSAEMANLKKGNEGIAEVVQAAEKSYQAKAAIVKKLEAQEARIRFDELVKAAQVIAKKETALADAIDLTRFDLKEIYEEMDQISGKHFNSSDPFKTRTRRTQVGYSNLGNVAGRLRNAALPLMPDA